MRNDLNRLEQVVKDYFLWLDMQRSPTPREALPAFVGASNEAVYHECGNCGVPRFSHGSILEACPNCGDDEIDLSLIDEVP